jgi:hypothetical protein
MGGRLQTCRLAASCRQLQSAIVPTPTLLTLQ